MAGGEDDAAGRQVLVADDVAGGLVVTVAGRWSVRDGLPDSAPILERIERHPPARLAFAAGRLESWDAGLVAFVIEICDEALRRDVAVDLDALPEGVRRLLALARATPERPADLPAAPPDILHRIGLTASGWWRSIDAAIIFIGEATAGVGRLAAGRVVFKRDEFVLLLQQTGAQALPIVSLISVLVGVILAFVGAVQLQMFGAQIYVANAVAVGMMREMGAMMTAIIMAGRTGAAFAAQIGTMQVNEEIDALRTLGVSPIDFLVTPRIVALCTMMPLLCVYSILLGVFGGFLIGVLMLGITPEQYATQTVAWIKTKDFFIGVFKSGVFGAIIAVAGCFSGMNCGRNAAAVGLAATSAVVTAIVWIIVSDGLFAVVLNVLGL